MKHAFKKEVLSGVKSKDVTALAINEPLQDGNTVYKHIHSI